MKKIKLVIILILFAFSTYAGDILKLNNELVFQGKVISINENSILFKSNNVEYNVPVIDIFSVQFENTNDNVYVEYLQTPMSDPNKCLNGRLDAENYHGKSVGHFFLGFLFGPFAIIGTALAYPTPDKGRKTYMMSTNKDQFNDPEYLSCYKKKAKGQLIGMEALGWGVWILLVFTL
jgi:hypothetical protein